MKHTVQNEQQEAAEAIFFWLGEDSPPETKKSKFYALQLFKKKRLYYSLA